VTVRQLCEILKVELRLSRKARQRKALDRTTAQQLAEFFRRLPDDNVVKQQLYEPLGSVWPDYREGGHTDHKHVATYDRGGILKPGMTIKFNPPKEQPEEEA
jgi:hypothetical protein